MKKAFTLAEVLITLGIIGVVAALTLPTLITNYKKRQTVVQLKKAYTELAQAVKLSEVENGDLKSWDCWNTRIQGTEFFDKYLSQYIKLSETPMSDVNQHITYYEISGHPERALAQFWYSNSKMYVLPSGTQIFAYGGGTSGSTLRYGFFVDLNGLKRPNTFGKDLFYLCVDKNKGVVFMQLNDNDNDYSHVTREELLNGDSIGGNYNYQCNRQGRGMWCGALIQMDGWEIKDDYPW
ncbi:MAG: type II secretion system GspH family protein [Clostridiaceae bacterium]|jgi:prepilin-type N-terminal cleavage/methylation domain-containing protein|nr:type II secretion system GspH family protein [Clostridiaceae bacterium]